MITETHIEKAFSVQACDLLAGLLADLVESDPEFALIAQTELTGQWVN